MSSPSNGLVSIIVPVWNLESYIDRCIESLVGQTYTNVELLLIDDGSTDGSWERIKAWAARDERIVAVRREHVGTSAARNEGLRRARGAYIGFADGDDYVSPEFVESLVAAIESNNADMAICSFDNSNISRFVPRLCDGLVTGASALPDILYGPMGGVIWNKLFLRALVLGATGDCNSLAECESSAMARCSGGHEYPILFAEELSCVEDTEWLIRVLCRETRIALVGDVLYHYVQRDGSATHPLDGNPSLKLLRSSMEANRRIVSYVQEWGGRHDERALRLAIRRLSRSQFAFLFKTYVAKGRRVDGEWRRQLDELRDNLALYDGGRPGGERLQLRYRALTWAMLHGVSPRLLRSLRSVWRATRRFAGKALYLLRCPALLLRDRRLGVSPDRIDTPSVDGGDRTGALS